MEIDIGEIHMTTSLMRVYGAEVRPLHLKKGMNRKRRNEMMMILHLGVIVKVALLQAVVAKVIQKLAQIVRVVQEDGEKRNAVVGVNIEEEDTAVRNGDGVTLHLLAVPHRVVLLPHRPPVVVFQHLLAATYPLERKKVEKQSLVQLIIYLNQWTQKT
jgi:hypothetical protein